MGNGLRRNCRSKAHGLCSRGLKADSAAQVDDGLGKDLGGGELVGNAGVLVGAVHVAVKAGHTAAESHAAGNIVDVGASANGQALPLVVGVLLVALEQGLDQRGVSGGVVGSVHLAGDGKAKLGKRCLCGGAAVLIAGADGYPAVKLALQASTVDGQQGKGQSQSPGQLIGLGDAQGLAGAVAVGEEGVERVEGGGGAHLGQGDGADR